MFTTGFPAESVGAIPKEITVIVDSGISIKPTHLLAVYESQVSLIETANRQAKLYPIHDIVLAAYCANLRPRPLVNVATNAEVNDQATLPVLALRVPCPNAFPVLLKFLYNPAPVSLLCELLGCASVEEIAHIPVDLMLKPRWSLYLARSRTAQELFSLAQMVVGLWMNAVTLGVFDQVLWRVMDYAWNVLYGALYRRNAQRRERIIALRQPIARPAA